MFAPSFTKEAQQLFGEWGGAGTNPRLDAARGSSQSTHSQLTFNSQSTHSQLTVNSRKTQYFAFACFRKEGLDYKFNIFGKLGRANIVCYVS